MQAKEIEALKAGLEAFQNGSISQSGISNDTFNEAMTKGLDKHYLTEFENLKFGMNSTSCVPKLNYQNADLFQI